MKITFQNLRDISDSLSKGDDTLLVKYLNQFEGKNTYEKFLNILKSWEEDVSHSISFSFDDKNIKVTLDYILSCFRGLGIDGFSFKSEDWEFFLGIPDRFTNRDLFDLTGTVKKVKFGVGEADFSQLNDDERDHIISRLPASKFNEITREVLNTKDFMIGLNNPSLNHININFLNNSPYLFLKGLFEPYDKDYFRDVIYHLSNKIGGQFLTDSTIADIDYYVEKMNDENRQSELPSLG